MGIAVTQMAHWTLTTLIACLTAHWASEKLLGKRIYGFLNNFTGEFRIERIHRFEHNTGMTWRAYGGIGDFQFDGIPQFAIIGGQMFQCLYANIAQRAERVYFMVMHVELFAQLIFGAFSDSCKWSKQMLK